MFAFWKRLNYDYVKDITLVQVNNTTTQCVRTISNVTVAYKYNMKYVFQIIRLIVELSAMRKCHEI